MFWLRLSSALVILPLTGCLVAKQSAHNLINEPREYLDERKLTRELRSDAKETWQEVCRQYPAKSFSEDFADGFIDGYTDYLESGGTAQTPSIPPLKYRRSRYLNPTGHAQIQDYFVGFQYGVDTAVASGQRQFLTVPILLPSPPMEMPLRARYIAGSNNTNSTAGTNVAPTFPGEKLPDPRPMDPATGLPIPIRPTIESPKVPDPVLPELPKTAEPELPKLPENSSSIEIPNVEIPVMPKGEPLTPAPSEPLPPPRFEFPSGTRSEHPSDSTIVPTSEQRSPDHSNSWDKPLADPPANPLKPLPDPKPNHRSQ